MVRAKDLSYEALERPSQPPAVCERDRRGRTIRNRSFPSSCTLARLTEPWTSLLPFFVTPTNATMTGDTATELELEPTRTGSTARTLPEGAADPTQAVKVDNRALWSLLAQHLSSSWGARCYEFAS